MPCDGRRSYLIEGKTQSVVRKAQIVEPQKRLAIFVSSMHGGGAQRQMLNLAGAKIVNIFNRRSDDLLIGYFLGPTALGYYVIAYRLVLVMTRHLTGVTQAVVLPMFSRLQNDVALHRMDTEDTG